MKQWNFKFDKPDFKNAPEGATHFAVRVNCDCLVNNTWTKITDDGSKYYDEDVETWEDDGNTSMYTFHKISDYYQESPEDLAKEFYDKFNKLMKDYDATIENQESGKIDFCVDGITITCEV